MRVCPVGSIGWPSFPLSLEILKRSEYRIYFLRRSVNPSGVKNGGACGKQDKLPEFGPGDNGAYGATFIFFITLLLYLWSMFLFFAPSSIVDSLPVILLKSFWMRHTVPRGSH
jgi:hypothetical protein